LKHKKYRDGNQKIREKYVEIEGDTERKKKETVFFVVIFFMCLGGGVGYRYALHYVYIFISFNVITNKYII